jgi:tRNA A-37 threonylcarbamoyl transferase component Bud32
LEQPLVEITPILGKGRINQIFLVQANSEDIVIRLNAFLPTADALEGYVKEQWCLEQAASIGVRGPSVLEIGQCEGQAYMIQSRVPGENAAEILRNKTSVWREIGRYSRLIHNIDLPVGERGQQKLPSGLCGPLCQATQSSWLQQVQEGLDALSDAEDPLEGFVYAKSQKDDLIAKFEELKSLLFRSGLHHGDLTLKNVMVDQQGNVHLLDWGSALVHNAPYYDVSQMLKSQVETNDPDAEGVLAFLSGYGLSSSEGEEMCSKSAIFLLLRTFGKVRWAMGCKHPNAPRFASFAKTLLSQKYAGLAWGSSA